jgi:alpha-glucuronidase
MVTARLSFLILFLASLPLTLRAEDGYDLWLRYHPVSDPALLAHYRASLSGILVEGDSPTLAAARDELRVGLRGLLGREVPLVMEAGQDGTVIACTSTRSTLAASFGLASDLKKVGEEGFAIRATDDGGKRQIIIAANADVGVLYGVFHFLRLLQTHQHLDSRRAPDPPSDSQSLGQPGWDGGKRIRRLLDLGLAPAA